MFKWFSKRRHCSTSAHNLYGSIVTMTREPALYNKLMVPDTLEKRFELLMLHVFVFLQWLIASPEETGKLRQAVVDRFFVDLEITSRQAGVGDLAVPKKMRQLAGVLTNRMEEYRDAVDTGTAGKMQRIIATRIFSDADGSVGAAKRLTTYVEGIASSLDKLSVDDVVSEPDLLVRLTETKHG